MKSDSFSEWFLRICKRMDIPIEIASGASAMMANLPQWHWGDYRRYLSCITCIRIAYKWVEDVIDHNKLRSLGAYANAVGSVDWFEEELLVLTDLGWNIRECFEPGQRRAKQNRKPRPLKAVA
jgi:hypothetical protein